MAYTFRKSPSAVRGITEVQVSGRSREFTRVSGWGCPIIIAEAGGMKAAFIAESCLKAVDFWPMMGAKGKSLRYGPGGRRVYVQITEEVVETFVKRGEHIRTSRNGKEFENDKEYAEDVRDFALALIDLL